MNKIPTVFRRDPDNPKHVLPEVVEGCEWVLTGEGRPTRKFDGTCTMYDGEQWWARREVRPGKRPPDGFVALSTDPNTGKTVGWEPIAQSSFAKWHAEALDNVRGSVFDHPPGTYELCGPKVQGNPERFARHVLVEHARAEVLAMLDGAQTFDSLREIVGRYYGRLGVEGVVWHHPDGRMAKLKARDFPRELAVEDITRHLHPDRASADEARGATP